jgi:hypothetical protein
LARPPGRGRIQRVGYGIAGVAEVAPGHGTGPQNGGEFADLLAPGKHIDVLADGTARGYELWYPSGAGIAIGRPGSERQSAQDVPAENRSLAVAVDDDRADVIVAVEKFQERVLNEPPHSLAQLIAGDVGRDVVLQRLKHPESTGRVLRGLGCLGPVQKVSKPSFLGISTGLEAGVRVAGRVLMQGCPRVAQEHSDDPDRGGVLVVGGCGSRERPNRLPEVGVQILRRRVDKRYVRNLPRRGQCSTRVEARQAERRRALPFAADINRARDRPFRVIPNLISRSCR